MLNSNQNIFLIGMMGVGKTTIANMLSKTLDKKFVDIDSNIENEKQLTIKNIFDHFGESYFRKEEQNFLLKISRETNQIIATGGGIMLLNKNRNILSKNSLVIYLMAEPEILYNRIKNSMNNIRPLLGSDFRLETIKQILDNRHKTYFSNSHIQFNTNNLPLNKIVKHLTKLIFHYENNFC